MNDEEILQKLSNLDAKIDVLAKKLDKVMNLLTKACKALYLLPVTEKEERALQIQQRENLAIKSKINDELDAMENKVEEDTYSSSSMLLDGTSITKENVYDDLLGDDF